MTDIIFSHKIKLVDNIWEMHFMPTREIKFIPGQYADLYLKLPQITESRIFTITSLPGDETISFTIKFPSPCSTYKQALLNLKQGGEMTMSEPKGDFILPRDSSRPLMFVAGGLGIASYVSMLKTTQYSHNAATTSLFYSHKHDEQLYQDLVSSRSSVNLHEFISPRKIATRDILDHFQEKSLIYISGSENFTLQIRDDLISHGINPTVILYDYFTGYNSRDF
jgi:ferredoxin-NADP reductase